MTSNLTIDRLDVRYHSVRPGEAERLDHALASLVATELADAVTRRMPSTDAEVCVPDLHIAIEIADPRNVRLVARQWADEIVDAIARRVGTSSGIVTYRNRVDALVDLVSSVGRGNSDRLWAWQQIGLVNTDVSTPTSDHVLRALLAHPDAVPGVLRRLGPRMELRLEPQEWIRLATAMDRFLGPIAGAPAPAPTSRPSTPKPLERALAVMLPWDRTDERTQLCLARLVATVARPGESASYAYLHDIARRWSHPFVDVRAAAGNAPDLRPARAEPTEPHTVARAETSNATTTDVDSPVRPPSDGSTGSASGRDERDDNQQLESWIPTRAASLVDESTDGSSSDPYDRAMAPSLSNSIPTRVASSDDESTTDLFDRAMAPSFERSSFGGVVFTVHCLRATDLVERIVDAPMVLDLSTALAHVLAEASGAEPGDAAVRLIAGCATEEDPQDLDAETATQVTLWSREVVGWLRERLELDDAGDLTWFWDRRAEIHSEPGWIEVVLPLDSVDFAIRRAGLDIDPGFVWWLGSVVRYRYV